MDSSVLDAQTFETKKKLANLKSCFGSIIAQPTLSVTVDKTMCSWSDSINVKVRIEQTGSLKFKNISYSLVN
jgi:hypothetical protein